MMNKALLLGSIGVIGVFAMSLTGCGGGSNAPATRPPEAATNQRMMQQYQQAGQSQGGRPGYPGAGGYPSGGYPGQGRPGMPR